MADGVGAAALSQRIRGTSAGCALPASLPVDGPAQFLSDDARWLFAVARGTQEAPCPASGRNSPRGRVPRGRRGARSESESEKELSPEPGDTRAGRRLMPGFSRTPVERARRENG